MPFGVSVSPLKVFAVLILAISIALRTRLAALLLPTLRDSPSMSSSASTTLEPQQPAEWRAALEALPTLEQTKGRIPAFFIAHGQPTLIHPKPVPQGMIDRIGRDSAPGGRQEAFLQDLGKFVLDRYKPKAIVVFSAHWETDEEVLVSDWGARNPILYDYYGFPDSLYKVDFNSHGSAQLSQHVVSLLQKAGIPARTTGVKEPRGMDGKTRRPGTGLDHGCLVPFRIMFDDSGPEGFPLPIVQVSIVSDPHRPADERALGAALRSLRNEGVLILTGGLTIHNLRSFSDFNEDTASTLVKRWHTDCLAALNTPKSPQERHESLAALERHMGFRTAHPRADHFAPIWVADGAGAEDAEGGGVRVLSALHGAISAAFL